MRETVDGDRGFCSFLTLLRVIFRHSNLANFSSPTDVHMLRFSRSYLRYPEQRIRVWTVPEQNVDCYGLCFVSHAVGPGVYWDYAVDIQDGCVGLVGPGSVAFAFWG